MRRSALVEGQSASYDVWHSNTPRDRVPTYRTTCEMEPVQRRGTLRGREATGMWGWGNGNSSPPPSYRVRERRASGIGSAFSCVFDDGVSGYGVRCAPAGVSHSHPQLHVPLQQRCGTPLHPLPRQARARGKWPRPLHWRVIRERRRVYQPTLPGDTAVCPRRWMGLRRLGARERLVAASA